ncbi:hypothetical protein GGX14DRAFT_389259 [Mycena pura]|uniref:Uncharacterized protein n=1 Tax=Mycena pura TaxID=153505 RepID=A0AAD6VT04_9AGAR|nr:hypothetical protein GGX14DRAFT_389259 [Mycena pura]
MRRSFAPAQGGEAESAVSLRWDRFCYVSSRWDRICDSASLRWDRNLGASRAKDLLKSALSQLAYTGLTADLEAVKAIMRPNDPISAGTPLAISFVNLDCNMALLVCLFSPEWWDILAIVPTHLTKTFWLRVMAWQFNTTGGVQTFHSASASCRAGRLLYKLHHSFDYQCLAVHIFNLDSPAPSVIQTDPKTARRPCARERAAAHKGARDIRETPPKKHPYLYAPSTLTVSMPITITTRPADAPSPSGSSSLRTAGTLLACMTFGAIAFVFLVCAAIAILYRVWCGRPRWQRRQPQDVSATEARKGASCANMRDPGRAKLPPPPPQQAEHRPSLDFECRSLPHTFVAAADPPSPPPLAASAPLARPRARVRPGLPFLFPARASDSGSAFREEVWPPPRQESAFVDPLLPARVGAADLAHIVTDIMGEGEGEGTPLVLLSLQCASEAGFGSKPASAAASTMCLARVQHDAGLAAGNAPTLRSTASEWTLCTATGNALDDDPSWPPTPSKLPMPVFERASPPPGAYPGISKGVRLVRPSTGDASYVKSWLERTPRRPRSAPGEQEEY